MMNHCITGIYPTATHWFNVSAHSEGLDKSFKNIDELVDAVDSTCKTASTYTCAIESTIKTMPEDDWFSDGKFFLTAKRKFRNDFSSRPFRAAVRYIPKPHVRRVVGKN